MNIIYLFEGDDFEYLVLHFPTEPGSMTAMCGLTFDEEQMYLPDADQRLSDFCPECQNGWVEYKTTNKHNWRPS